MRLIHKLPFSPQETESYRQLVFDNITRGLRYILDAMDEFEIKVSEENLHHVEIIDNAKDIGDGEPFPIRYIEPLKALWTDPNVQRAYERGNEAALPEKYAVIFATPRPAINDRRASACLISSPILIGSSSRTINQRNKT